MPLHLEYLLASRQGLFRVSRAGARLLRPGKFFGIVLHQGAVFAFRTCADINGEDTERSGCIVRFDWRDDGELGEPQVLVDGLDYNCHQIDFFDGAFFVIDTLHQCVREYDPDWRPVARHQILPEAVRNGPDHAHINSIAGDAQTVRLLLHNGHRGRPSEIVEYDRAFRERSRRTLPCEGCHDIVPLEDGRILTCLSPRGEIMLDDGRTVAINEYWTRGLAVTRHEIAVGSSFFGVRIARAILPGFVTFLDRDFRELKRIYVPAAPTQLRAL
ncbi:MAG: hypothetical protein WDN08_17375 [Rhizomicrobium sp.]